MFRSSGKERGERHTIATEQIGACHHQDLLPPGLTQLIQLLLNGTPQQLARLVKGVRGSGQSPGQSVKIQPTASNRRYRCQETTKVPVP